MAFDVYTELSTLLNVDPETVVMILLLIFLWKVIWYAFAIYQTIEKRQKAWFIVLFVGIFVLNDLGLLAIIYLLLYKKKRNDTKPTKVITVKKKKKK